MHRLWTTAAGEPVRGADFAGQGARVQGFARCPDGSVYAATVDGVLALGANARQTRVLAPGAQVNAIFCDRGGNLLIGDRDGLQQLDRAHATLAPLWSAATPGALNGVSAIAQDHAGILWLGVPGAGLVRYDRAHGLTGVLQPQSGLAGTLPDTGIDKLLIDRSGLLWLGTWTSGAAYTDPAGAPFHDVVDLNPSRTPGSNHINALAEAADGSVWLSTGMGGLRRYDPRADSFQDFGDTLQRAVPPADNGPPGVFVFALDETAPGRWTLATSRGLLQFDPAHNSATRAGFADPRIDTLLDGGVRAMLRTRNGDLWLAPLRSGLLQIRDGKLVHQYGDAPSPNGLADNVVLELAQDPSGQIWAGTANGVSRIEPDSGRVRSFREIPGHRDSLAGRTVTSLHVAADGTVWIGTQSGLNRLLWIDDAGAHFTRYGAGDGLPDE
ncbi:MAG: ligand-binding sensor domain-containing protein, partial [Rhodanobacteraceae bacterium]